MVSSMLIAIEHKALFLRFLIIFYISVFYVNYTVKNRMLILRKKNSKQANNA